MVRYIFVDDKSSMALNCILISCMNPHEHSLYLLEIIDLNLMIIWNHINWPNIKWFNTDTDNLSSELVYNDRLYARKTYVDEDLRSFGSWACCLIISARSHQFFGPIRSSFFFRFFGLVSPISPSPRRPFHIFPTYSVCR